MNETELHESQHENIINELDHVANLLHEKEECDADLLKRVKRLECNRTAILAVSRAMWWKAVVLLIALALGFFGAVILIDVVAAI